VNTSAPTSDNAPGRALALVVAALAIIDGSSSAVGAASMSEEDFLRFCRMAYRKVRVGTNTRSLS